MDLINTFIKDDFMPTVYANCAPNTEEQNDEDWWSDTFIHTAVNSELYVFADMWYERDDRHIFNDTSFDAFWVVEMINRINKWNDDEYGNDWSWEKPLTLDKILNMYAYLYVNVELGTQYWIEQRDRLNQYALENEEESDAEEEEEKESVEVYNGSKVFPPNETDETCPMCLEEYDKEIGRLKDGIQNSEYESNCPHWGCCMCWRGMYKQNKEKYCCPICRRDITDWLKIHYDDEDDE
jgi:hypothetical protein